MISYRPYIRTLIIFITGWWSTHPANAQGEVITLLGGEMNYSCVRKRYNGSVFEISLRLRRDCRQEVPFDSTAKVMIFEASPDDCHYTVPAWVKLKLVRKQRLPVSPEACTGFCDSICVEEAFYREEVALPSCPGGYILAYQRCCRDEDLDNIVDPGLNGGTWWVHISKEAAKECNSSPRFPGWTDRIICSDSVYQLDFSATDRDGDSLVYRLYTPHIGADRDDPRPQFISEPPYDSVRFLSPYSKDNLIGGNIPFQIDPVSGLITAIPKTTGQFLIGIAVDEFRNGMWLGTVRSDYQIEVCGLDSCIAPRDTVWVCQGETVQLLDLLKDFIPSKGCQYSWYPEEGLIFDLSDLHKTNPKWKAQETTRFTVVASNDLHSDTGYVYAWVDPGPVLTLPDTAFIQCLDSDCVIIKADSTYDYRWDPEPEVSIDADSVIFTFCDLPVNRYYQVTTSSRKLASTPDDELFCTRNDSFYVTADPVVELIPDTICPGDTSDFLLRELVACWTYEWALSESLIFSDSLVRAAPSVTTTYRVTVTNGTEVAEDSVTVVVLPTDSVSIEVLMSPFLCDGRATLIGHTTGSTANSTFLWSFSPDFSVIESMEDTFHLETQLDMLTIYLTATEQPGSTGPFCGSDTKQITVVNKSISLKATYSTIDTCFTDTTSVLIQLDTLRGAAVDSIKWSTADPRNWVDPDSLTVNPIQVRTLPGQREIVLYYETTFQGSCNVRDSLIVDITGAWTFNLLTEQNFCGDTTILTIKELTERDNASFTWYNGVPGEEGSQILGTGKSLTVTGDIIPVIFVTGEAFWCRDTMMALIDVPPKLGSVQVTPSRLCLGDTALVVLSPLSGHRLSTIWETNGLVVDSTDTFLMVVAIDSIDSLRISYKSISDTCPNLTCDSMLVLPLDSVVNPKPMWMKLPCTYQAVISVDTTVYRDGDIQWVIPAFSGTSLAATDTLTFPGPGSYSVILLPSPNLSGCLFNPDTLTIVIPEFIRLKPVPDTSIFTCANPMTSEDSLYRLSVMPTIDNIGITWTDVNGDTLGTGLEILVNPYTGDTLVYAISDADSCDCRDTITFQLMVSQCQFLIAGQAGDYCADKDFSGPSVYLLCDRDTITEAVYDWQPSEFIVSGRNSPTPVFNALASFQATVTILDTARNCAFDTTFFIEIFQKPSVTIIVDPEKVLSGLSATLSAIPSTTDPYAYAWSTQATTQAITVLPPENGATYQVTITDAHGCCDSSSVTIEPLPCRYGIPTAFSPNDDGLNDFFLVRSSCPLVDFEMKIINRFGQEVFSTTKQEPGWDGTMAGQKLPPDAYAYCVILRCPNEEEKKTIFGDVSLVR